MGNFAYNVYLDIVTGMEMFGAELLVSWVVL